MRPVLIAADVGNSSVKLGRFDRVDGPLPHPIATFDYPTKQHNLPNFELLPEGSVEWWVASVHRDGERRLADWVRENRPGDRYHCFRNGDLPLKVSVVAPDRVGTDRLVAAVGANCLRPPHVPAIVVDAGTAITVDLLDESGTFQGGAILPGLQLMASSLATSTDQLPHIQYRGEEAAPSVVGKSTENAMQSGLYWGAIGAVREVILQMERGLKHAPTIYVTGGWAAGMAQMLRLNIQYIPHLVLGGIAASASK